MGGLSPNGYKRDCATRTKCLATCIFTLFHIVSKSLLAHDTVILEKDSRGLWWPWNAHLSQFPHKWNSTPLFLWSQLVTPGVGPVLIPRGIMWIKLTKVYKEMLHTENLSCIFSSFREEEFWNWSSLFLCSNLRPQEWDQFWPQRNHMNKIDKGPQRDAKYQISKL